MISTNLTYVALVVSDVPGTATVLSRDFGLPRTDCAVGSEARTVPVFTVGGSAIALFAAGDPFLEGEARPGVHHLALEVQDLEGAGRRAAAAGVPVADAAPHHGLQGARRWRLDADATCGVRTYLSEPLALDRANHAWVERIDHLGVASRDNRAVLETFVGRLGCGLESTQTDLEVQFAVESFTSDKYGVVYHTRAPQALGGLRIAFVTVGDCELEFLEDFDPSRDASVEHGRPGTTKQDRSAIARYIASRGPGLHHVALKVTDINGALSRLAAAGHALIDKVGRPGSRRALIGFLHPKALGGVLMHLVQR
jgi:hypothetical protein